MSRVQTWRVYITHSTLPHLSREGLVIANTLDEALETAKEEWKSYIITGIEKGKKAVVKDV